MRKTLYINRIPNVTLFVEDQPPCVTTAGIAER